MNKSKPVFVGAGIGFLVGLALFVISLLAMGGGHGSYAFVYMFFPYAYFASFALGIPGAVLLALVQYPAYGWTFAVSLDRSAKTRRAIVLVGVHILVILIIYVLSRILE